MNDKQSLEIQVPTIEQVIGARLDVQLGDRLCAVLDQYPVHRPQTASQRRLGLQLFWPQHQARIDHAQPLGPSHHEMPEL
jgi:hypothetical protein